jgi:bacteriorhodopsin
MTSTAFKQHTKVIPDKSNVVFDHTYTHITQFGMAWCGLVASIMAASMLYFIVSCLMVKRGNRSFYGNVIIMHLFSIGSYLLMADNQGFSMAPVQFYRAPGHVVDGVLRQVSFVRYFDWLVTTPVGLNIFPITSMLSNTFDSISLRHYSRRLMHRILSSVSQCSPAPS